MAAPFSLSALPLTEVLPVAIGQALDLDITVTLEGVGNLAGNSLHFTVKASADDTDANALTRKDTGSGGSGITILNQTDGRARIKITRSDTLGWPAGKLLYGDAWLVADNDPTQAYPVGSINFRTYQPITRRNSASV
jgi:hypothetical protein